MIKTIIAIRTREFARVSLLLLIVSSICVNDATEYFVALSGSDLNDGTAAKPVRTVQRALRLAVPGDTVRVGRGEYAEAVETVRSGSPALPITVDGGGEAVIWTWRAQHDYQRLLNVRLLNLDKPLPNGMVRLGYTRPVSGCIVSNCVLDGAYSRYGVAVQGSTAVSMHSESADNLVTKNVISNFFAGTAVVLTGIRNTVSSNSIVDTYDADCLRFFEGVSNRFTGNLFANERKVVGDFHSDCFQCFASSSGPGRVIDSLWIDGNVFRDVDSQIGNLEERTATVVNIYTNINIVNNIFIRTASNLGSSVPNVLWANNTFIECSWNKQASHLLNFSSDSKGIANNNVILNNIFLRCTQGTNDPNKGWYSFGPGLVGSYGDYNFVRGVGTSAKVTRELHAVLTAVPIVIDETGGSFRPAVGTPLVNSGTNLSSIFTHDFYGERRLVWGVGAVAGVLSKPSRPTNISALP